MYGIRLARWERAAEGPLTIAASVFLAAYATQILARPEGPVEAVAEVLLAVTWLMFLVDHVARLALAERRGRWFSRHLLDLAVVALPMLRPLRLMRFLTIVSLIQRNAGSMLSGKVVISTVVATALTILVSALAVLDAERGTGGPIQDFGDAIWWAFVTVTTVGFGDFVPVSVTGRVVAVGLMVGGIALIGVVAATLASWIVERVSLETEQAAAATEGQVEALRDEIAQLKELIRDLRPAS